MKYANFYSYLIDRMQNFTHIFPSDLIFSLVLPRREKGLFFSRVGVDNCSNVYI